MPAEPARTLPRDLLVGRHLRRAPISDRSHRWLDLLRGQNCATIDTGAMPILWRAS